MAPRVSICIPSYNYATYLPETLDSLLAQTYPDYEIVVVDDASKDDSQAVAESYARRYPEKVRVFTHPGRVNKGISATCNLAIEKSRGEYLAWLGSDDAWYPDKLARQVDELDRNLGIGMTYSYADIIDSKGVKTGELVGRDMTHDLHPMLVAGNFVPHLTAIHRRACLEKTGLYDETLQYSDWDMWLKMANFFHFSFIDQPLAMYRVHGVNMYTGSTIETQTRHNLAVIEKFIPAPIAGPLASPRVQALLTIRLAQIKYCLGEVKQAESCLQNCFLIDPVLAGQGKYLAHWLDLFLEDPAFGLFATSYFPQDFRSQFEITQLEKAAYFYRSRDLPKARDYASRSIRMDLRNADKRELVGIIIQASTSPRFYKILRSLRRRSAG
jgi:glycosyltransferase involved in cell wall biosynthesis